MARDRAMEHWLQTQVGLAYDALKSDLSRAVPISQVRKRLAAVNHSATSKA
jgi:antitoxin ParD1/3/4